MAYDPNMRILIVDDFSTMRRIIKNILRQLDLNNVVEADDGTTAWEVLNKDHIDFIISDWNMPQMTGIELLRKVRASEDFGHLPFLMVTAEAQQSSCPGPGFQLYCQAVHRGNHETKNRQDFRVAENRGCRPCDLLVISAQSLKAAAGSSPMEGQTPV